MDMVLLVWPHQCRAQKKHHLFCPADNAFPNAAKDAVDLCHEGGLLGHGQLIVLQDPYVLLWRAAFQMVNSQSLLVHGVIPTQRQDFEFSFVELHEIPLDPILQPI